MHQHAVSDWFWIKTLKKTKEKYKYRYNACIFQYFASKNIHKISGTNTYFHSQINSCVIKSHLIKIFRLLIKNMTFPLQPLLAMRCTQTIRDKTKDWVLIMNLRQQLAIIMHLHMNPAHSLCLFYSVLEKRLVSQVRTLNFGLFCTIHLFK